jgi:hypothetical protein
MTYSSSKDQGAPVLFRLVDASRKEWARHGVRRLAADRGGESSRPSGVRADRGDSRAMGRLRMATDQARRPRPNAEQLSRKALLVMASHPDAGASVDSVEATTIPGTKVLLDPRPKAVVVGAASDHHRKRRTSPRHEKVRDEA